MKFPAHISIVLPSAMDVLLSLSSVLPLVDISMYRQGRSDGGISVYIPPKSVYLKKLCSCSSSVSQDRFAVIYVHVWDINVCFEIAMTS